MWTGYQQNLNALNDFTDACVDDSTLPECAAAQRLGPFRYIVSTSCQRAWLFVFAGARFCYMDFSRAWCLMNLPLHDPPCTAALTQPLLLPPCFLLCR